MLEDKRNGQAISSHGAYPIVDTPGKHFVSKDRNYIFIYCDLDATPNQNGTKWRNATNPSVRV